MQFWQSCKKCSATRWNIFLLIVWKWFEVQTSQEENEFTESVSLDPYVAVLTTLLKQLRQRRKNFQPIVRNWWEKGLFSKTASQKSPMVLSNAVLTALPKWSCRRSDSVLVKVQERQKKILPKKNSSRCYSGHVSAISLSLPKRLVERPQIFSSNPKRIEKTIFFRKFSTRKVFWDTIFAFVTTLSKKNSQKVEIFSIMVQKRWNKCFSSVKNSWKSSPGYLENSFNTFA